jgi:hypothetical protein
VTSWDQKRQNWDHVRTSQPNVTRWDQGIQNWNLV